MTGKFVQSISPGFANCHPNIHSCVCPMHQAASMTPQEMLSSTREPECLSPGLSSTLAVRSKPLQHLRVLILYL